MPIDYRHYPPNWKEISLRIREREEWRCKWCGAINGEPHPDTGSIVVLTTAHLGTPIITDRIGPLEFPFLFQVTGAAKADEVFQVIRFLVAFQAKQFERTFVMHDRAIAERFAVFPTHLASIAVSLSCVSSSLLPSRAIVAETPAFPVGVSFTDWSLFSKPFEPTGVTTKPIALSDLVAAYFVDLPASFAGLGGQWIVARMGIHAVQFSVTRFGAGFLALFGLFSRQIENCTADDARGFGRTSTDWAVGNWFAESKLSPMFFEAFSRADFLIVSSLIDRQWKKSSTDNAVALSGGLPSFATGTRELFAETAAAQKFTSATIGASPLAAGLVGDRKGSLADFAGFDFHTCIIPQYHTGEQIPYYTPGNKHDKHDVRDENLAALCQRCHLNYDRDEHIYNAALTRRRKRELAGQMRLKI